MTTDCRMLTPDELDHLRRKQQEVAALYSANRPAGGATHFGKNPWLPSRPYPGPCPLGPVREVSDPDSDRADPLNLDS